MLTFVALYIIWAALYVYYHVVSVRRSRLFSFFRISAFRSFCVADIKNDGACKHRFIHFAPEFWLTSFRRVFSSRACRLKELVTLTRRDFASPRRP